SVFERSRERLLLFYCRSSQCRLHSPVGLHYLPCRRYPLANLLCACECVVPNLHLQFGAFSPAVTPRRCQSLSNAPSSFKSSHIHPSLHSPFRPHEVTRRP